MVTRENNVTEKMETCRASVPQLQHSTCTLCGIRCIRRGLARAARAARPGPLGALEGVEVLASAPGLIAVFKPSGHGWMAVAALQKQAKQRSTSPSCSSLQISKRKCKRGRY